jgi:hypothetical protein
MCFLSQYFYISIAQKWTARSILYYSPYSEFTIGTPRVHLQFDLPEDCEVVLEVFKCGAAGEYTPLLLSD